MKEIERLIEEAIIVQENEINSQNEDSANWTTLAKAITAAEAMLKRAVVIDDSHFLPESLESVVSLCHVKPLNALEGKRVRIIVIPEEENAE